MNILLTGGTGFIGKHLTKKLTDLGHTTYLFKRDSNINDFEHLKIDGIIHLATLYSPKHDSSDVTPMLSANLHLPTNLLEFCKKKSIKWFINTNSIAQFKNENSGNYSNLYLATKLAFLEICKYYEGLNQTTICHLTISDTFGPGDTRGKIMQKWKESIENNIEIKMTSGKQTVHMLYIDDVIDGFIHLAKMATETPQVVLKKNFYLNYKNNLNLNSLSRLVGELTNKNLRIQWNTIQPLNNIEESPFVGELLPDWKPNVGLEDGIKIYFKRND